MNQALRSQVLHWLGTSFDGDETKKTKKHTLVIGYHGTREAWAKINCKPLLYWITRCRRREAWTFLQRPMISFALTVPVTLNLRVVFLCNKGLPESSSSSSQPGGHEASRPDYPGAWGARSDYSRRWERPLTQLYASRLINPYSTDIFIHFFFSVYS